MAQRIMFTAKSASLRAFVRGERTFRLFGITLTIQHAHDDEYQVLLPDMSEIVRIVDCGNGSAKLYVV